MRFSKTWMLWWAIGASAPANAQDDAAASRFAGAPRVERLENGLRLWFIESPQATEISIALAIPAGWQSDPAGSTGCAEVMRWFFETAQRDQPIAQRFTIEVQPRLTLLSHNGSRRDAVDRLAFLERLMAGRLEVTEDRVAIALGRARLESDNHVWLYPGSVMEQKAWRTLLRGEAGGRQSRGIADEIARLDVAAVRRRYHESYGCTGATLVVIGNPGSKAWADYRARLGKLSRTAGAPSGVVHDAAPPVVADAQHRRIGGPYVTAAIKALRPADADYAAFVVAMVALRDHVYAEFRQRGLEWKALSPPFAYAFWKDDQIVRLSRRGRNGVGVAKTREEVATFLQRLRRTGIRRSALQPAKSEAARTLAAPPYASPAGAYLILRARYLATAACLGWPTDVARRIGEVELEDVNRVLKDSLAPARVGWFSLRPPPSNLPRKM
jgi:predicted Zn-dependent peptidase